MTWSRRYVIDLEELSIEEIMTVLHTAKWFKNSLRKSPSITFDYLKGYTVCNLFFEASTRTRMSFTTAEQRLGMHVLDFAVNSSSTNKGESVIDTIKNLDAMNLDVFVMRHKASGAPMSVINNSKSAFINAGDGKHAHPTQAFLDLLTIYEQKGGFEGLNVVICGDIQHSRVARSNVWGLTKLGAKVTLVGPPTLTPYYFEEFGVKCTYNYLDTIPRADVLYLLRIQFERMSKGYFPTVSEYTRLWGLTDDKLKLAKNDVLVMHPGPTNRDMEISGSVADGDKSFILDQVTSGVAVRMALLHLVLRGELNV